MNLWKIELMRVHKKKDLKYKKYCKEIGFKVNKDGRTK